MISPTEKADGDGQLETDRSTESERGNIVWTKPEGAYTPDCPIGNPYCMDMAREPAGCAGSGQKFTTKRWPNCRG